MPLSASERKRKQRDRERQNRDIVRGAEQASQEKHESVTQRQERIDRALGYSEWLTVLRPDLLSDATEQEIREHYGYGGSETRTQAERAEAAQRMVEKSQAYLRDIATERETGDPHPRETGTIDC